MRGQEALAGSGGALDRGKKIPFLWSGRPLKYHLPEDTRLTLLKLGGTQYLLFFRVRKKSCFLCGLLLSFRLSLMEYLEINLESFLRPWAEPG